MKLKQFNRWNKREKEILFEDQKIQHIKTGDYIYFYDKNDDDIYFFSDLNYYNKTIKSI
jgi:hypothetical protein